MQKLSYFLIIALFVGLAGCGDNGTGSGEDPGQPPVVPDLSVKAQPDISFFKENSPQKTSSNTVNATSNFSMAKTYVLGWSSFFTIGQSYGTFFNQAKTEEATFNNGVWVWNYSYNYEGMSAEYRMTAEEMAGSVKWAMSWSFSDGQTTVEDYRIVEGTVSNDGNHGDWTFNSLNPDNNQEVPVITSTWDITSDTQKTMNLQFFDENGAVTTTVDYEANVPNYTMTFTSDGSGQTVVTWNDETNIGSISEDGTTQCWDQNFQDVPCS